LRGAAIKIQSETISAVPAKMRGGEVNSRNIGNLKYY
jgi:hypothetical protein